MFAFAELAPDAALIPEEYRAWWANYLTSHADHFREVLSLMPRSGSVLEIGSVPGHLTVALARMGYQVQGVDIAPERAGEFFKKHGIEVAKVDVERDKLPFEDARFDTVIFTEILEHLRVNPLFALREVRRVIRPEGRLILSTPNITPLDRLLFLFGRDYQGNPVEEFKKLEWLGHMGHIRIYSAKEVRRMAREAGFELVAVKRGGRFKLGKPGSKARRMAVKLITAALKLWPGRASFRSILYCRCQPV